ncbi:MAG: LamG-like jellyroll fold domain-containing protein [Planctomycetota bacterium]
MRRHILTTGIIAVFFISNSACLAAPPVLEVSPTYMEFTAEQGGTDPPSQALSIWKGGGNGPLRWDVTEDCNWIEVTPDSGTSMGEVDVAGVFVDISGLAAGIYGCELTVTGDRAAKSPQIVDVNLIITGPEIQLSATHFDFSAYLGGSNPPEQVLGISNSGSGTLNWQITDDCNWLSAEPNTGSSTGEVDDVNLSVDITGLGVGIYDCNLIVSDSNAGNSPQIASATLSITMAEGIWVDPNSFDVNLIEGTTLTEVMTIGNGGAEDVNFIIRSRIVSNPEASAEKLGISSIPKGHDFTVVGDAPYKPGQLIVRFAPTSNGKVCSTTGKSQILSSLGGGIIRQNFKIIPSLSIVQLPAAMTVEEALLVFNNADGILYAEPDYEVEISSTFPDDPRFDDLWGMHNTGQTGGVADADIDAPEAWDIGTGSRDIIAAVIDTGVDYTHPDLAQNMWVNEAEYSGTPGVDDDNNGYVDDIYGYDFYNYDGDPMDDSSPIYHGTHCSGTIGALGNNGEGVAGVCWKVKIMALKFLSSGGGGWTSDAIMCVDYSVLMGANLSSNSWGGGGYSQGLKDAIDTAGAAGMLFVASAGNDNSNTDTYPHYPSSYDSESVISVMSTTRNDSKSGFSNYGPISVDLGAPGSDILSCKGGGGYQYLSGTSMAGPHVAGACALLWSMNQTLSNSEVKDILLQSVDETLTGLCVSEGRLNLYNAILGTRAPWLEIEPEEGTVGAGDSNDVNVTFSAFEQGLEMTPGIYEAEIVVISNDACNPMIVVPAAMTVTADDLAVVPREGFDPNGIEGGPFEPECKTYTLTNDGTAAINWTTSGTESWLNVEPNSGVLDPNTSVDVNICVTADANLLDPNIYIEPLIFENTESNSIKPRPVTLTVKPPDCFTQSVVRNLDYLSVMFSPDGSNAYYEACRERVEAFPIDPNGGTPVSLGDDDYAEVILANDANILFYGTRYDRFYIGSNGYITFGAGDSNSSASLENHFNLPRISALFADLNPSIGGSVSYKQLDESVVVTFEDVPLSGSPTATNSFQIEMFFVDGSICVSWLELLATSGVAGLSKGRGLPPVYFFESNLSTYPPCCLLGDFSRDYYVTLTDFVTLAMNWLDEDCGIPYWCELSDLDFSSIVDGSDLGIFADNWLAKDEWWLEPVGHWKFDEGDGNTAYDSVGFNHGIIEGAAWTAGKFEGALDFDGSGDYVVISNEENFDFGSDTDFTVCAWIKTTATSNRRRIVNKCESGHEPYTGFSLYMDPPGIVKFRLKDNADVVIVETTTSVNDGFWHFVTGVADRDGDIKIYRNGIPEDTDSLALVDNINNNIPVAVGRSMDYDGQYFDGTIDDVRIYSRALSTEEIWQIYQGKMAGKASNPNPADTAINVDPNTILTWSPGKDAASHDVYFGTNYNDVNEADTSSPEFMGNYSTNSYDPYGLDVDTTYYWRIDEVNDPNLWKGDVWSFTTWVSSNPIAWWKFDEGSGTTVYDSAGNNDGTVYDANWTSGKIGSYALDFDGSGDYVVISNEPNFDFGSDTDFTVCAWIKTTATTDRRRIVNKCESGHEPYTGFGFYMDPPGIVKFRLKDTADVVIVETTTSVNDGSWRFATGVADRDGDIKIYHNGSLEDTDSLALVDNINNNIPVAIGRSMDYNGQYFDGTIDNVRIYARALSDIEIWQLYREGAGEKAFNPNPVDAAPWVDPNTVLTWSPGKYAALHDVYFGTDYNDVNDATTSSTEYKGRQDANSWDPNGLFSGCTYSWRIDEVNDPNLWKGDVWSFTTFEPDPNLLSWWKFDEGSGTTAYDSAGNNDGNISGASWTTGQIGGALDFDGTNDYVQISNEPNFDFGPDTDFTVCAWINTTAILDRRRIVNKCESGHEPYTGFSLYMDPPGIVKFRLKDDADVVIVETTTSVNDGSWHFVAGVADRDGDIKIYHNGIPEDTDSLALVDNINNNIPVAVGRSMDYDGQYFDGKIDDVRIYDRALTTEEIEQLYQDGL